MKKHKIGWLNVPGYTPETWNPIVGCSKVSAGCENCYAERMAYRLGCMSRASGPDVFQAYLDGIGYLREWTGKTTLVKSALEKPLGWTKPRAIFVNSMGDLFHENTPPEWIDRVFSVMALCPQHLFIVLTKRAERMSRFVQSYYRLPNKNIWFGVTAENQAAADERITHLLRTPAAVRFVSCEPMIGPVDLEHVRPVMCPTIRQDVLSGVVVTDSGSFKDGLTYLDWIICGGESGPGARAMNPDWARGLRDQAQAAGVPFFFKQWGSHRTRDQLVPIGEQAKFKGRGGDVLDGRQWQEFPNIGKDK